MKSLKIHFTLFLLLSNVLCVYGQRTIKGRIIDTNFETLPIAGVYDADTLLLGKTAIDGYFEVSVPDRTNTLIFGFIGYEFTTTLIPDNCEYLEVILMPYVRYHFKSNRKIDRLRKKEFDKLPALHRIAVGKGLFKIDKPCYQREFEPIKSRLDKISKQSKSRRESNRRYFKELAVGDTIRIPYSGTYRYDGKNRTTLFDYSYVVDGKDFDCIIEGVIVDKNRRGRGYNVVYKVTDTRQCNYENIVYNNKKVLVGEEFRQNMKYFKVIPK